MKKLSLLFVTVCLLLASVPRTAAAGEPQWLRVTTPNFVVYCDGGEGRARETAERLEGFRALLASLFPKEVAASRAGRVPVVVFKSDNDYKPYKPLYNGKPANVAGLFLGGDEQAMITLDASAWSGSSHVIFHEYLHRLLAGSDKPVPLWFNEGVAEFYSTATTDGTKGQLGKIVPGHFEVLQDRGFMPLEALFAVSHDSPDYNERSRQSVFYAESWALVHYCVLDPAHKRPGQLIDFANRQSAGEPIGQAFKTAFGIEPAEMEKALRSYVRQTTIPIFNLTFVNPIQVEKATAEAAPPVEVEYYLGTALALEQRYDDAEPHFRRGMEADATSSLPYEGLGFVQMRKKDLGAARASFEEATKRDSKSSLALYYYAVASLNGPGDGGKHPEVRAALERAVAIDPAYAPVYEMLTVVALRDGDAKGATAWAERGLAIEPQNGRIRVNLAVAELNQGKADDARVNLKRVVDTAEDAGSRTYARTLLDRLDEMAANHATIAAAPAPESGDFDGDDSPAPTTGPPTLVRRGDLGGGSGDGGGGGGGLSLGDEHIRVAEGEVRGTVTRVDCDGKRTTVHVLVHGVEHTYVCDDSSTMILGTMNLGSLEHESIDCGKKMEREAFVQFDPDGPDATTGALRAVIFVAPAK